MKDSIDEVELKAALVELIDERPEALKEILAEVIEDMGLVRAIEEGKLSKDVACAEVLRLLEGSVQNRYFP